MTASPSIDAGPPPLYWTERLLARWELSPGRVTLVYLVFGLGALYVSDVLFVRYFSDPLLSQLQAVKGGVEVALTAGLVFLLTRASRVPLEHTNDQLERQREELQVLHRVLRHNLRNDLNVIHGYADKLRNAATSRRSDEWYACIERRTETIVEYAEQAGRIRHVTEGNGRSHVVNLTEAIPVLLERHELVDDRVDIRVDLPEGVQVEANHMFEEALDELVANAIAHNDADGSRVEIEVDPTAGPGHVTELSIRDDGPGIPAHVRRVMERAVEDPLLHLDGMGLWFAYWTVVDSGGTLSIETNRWGGTTVRLRLPKAPSILDRNVLGAMGL